MGTQTQLSTVRSKTPLVGKRWVWGLQVRLRVLEPTAPSEERGP